MALRPPYNRVKETSATTGTGAYTLAGAVTGFQGVAVIGDGNQQYFCAFDATNWEVFRGTYTASGTTLSRDAILSSSNGGAAVSWVGAGPRTITLVDPAEMSLSNVAGAARGMLAGAFV